jgi:hypothetical protein
MTLHVGDNTDAVLTGTFRVGGELAAFKELPKGSDVRVVITDQDGEVVATSVGRVMAIAFMYTERAHKIRCE